MIIIVALKFNSNIFDIIVTAMIIVIILQLLFLIVRVIATSIKVLEMNPIVT